MRTKKNHMNRNRVIRISEYTSLYIYVRELELVPACFLALAGSETPSKRVPCVIFIFRVILVVSIYIYIYMTNISNVIYSPKRICILLFPILHIYIVTCLRCPFSSGAFYEVFSSSSSTLLHYIYIYINRKIYYPRNNSSLKHIPWCFIDSRYIYIYRPVSTPVEIEHTCQKYRLQSILQVFFRAWLETLFSRP